MTAHVDTGEPLPRALFDKMLAAKNFQSGLQTLRQVEFALFDMLLHAEPTASRGDVQALLDEVRDEVAVVPPPAFNRTPNTLHPHLRRRLRGRLLQLQVGRGAVGRRLSAFEETAGAERRAQRRDRPALPRERSSKPAAAARAMEASRRSAAASRSIDALLRHQGLTDQ